MTNNAVEKLFGVKVEKPLFDIKYPSLTRGCAPAILCPLGLERMAGEFLDFPDQYKINLDNLKSWLEEDSYRNGYEYFEREYERLSKE